MEKRWRFKSSPSIEAIQQLTDELKVNKVIAQLFIQRGIENFDSANNFLNPTIEELHDPFIMKDMKEAVERLSAAVSKNEKVLIYGDYDVDGTTAVAMTYTFLKAKVAHIKYYIPDRYSEGYGVSFQGIDYAYQNGFTLIIALDCGVRAVEQIAYAKKLKIDFIVCDHHQTGEVLPDCIVLDPKREDCRYPFKELSGCGVGFKFLQACCMYNNWDTAKLYSFLDFVAVSIGADIVSVTGENRILCYHGMKLLNQNTRLAFKALLSKAKKTFPISLTDVVFAIAPRINAAGRLRSGREAVALMISDRIDHIERIAQEIEEDNSNRKTLDKSITAEALFQLEQHENHHQLKSTVVFNKDWHKGVVGIVASRLIEKHYKPTIVLTESNGVATGSARTVNNFDIYSALLECEHLLDQFGGHTHAAGLSLPIENVSSFKEHFEQVVTKRITAENESPEIQIDIEVNAIDLLNAKNRSGIPEIKKQIDQFEPFGPGNMKPVFLIKNCFPRDYRILKEEHLKMTFAHPSSTVNFDAIGFNMADKSKFLKAELPIDIVFTLETNEWNGKTSLQFNLKDLRPTL